MSIVTEVKDSYDDGRRKTALEEVRIDKEGAFAKWCRSDVTRTNSSLRILVLVVLSPAVALWALMASGALFAICINLLLYIGFDAIITAVRERRVANIDRKNIRATTASRPAHRRQIISQHALPST